MHARRPHPFLLLLLAALLISVVAAALAPDRAPAIALYWNPIYRAEIALVVLAIAYLLCVVGWMSWHGEAFRRIELPGGTALERDASELDAAATGLREYQVSLESRLDDAEDAMEQVITRLERLESGSEQP